MTESAATIQRDGTSRIADIRAFRAPQRTSAVPARNVSESVAAPEQWLPLVARLLDDATHALDSDQHLARTLVERAAAVVRAAGTRGVATPSSGTLAPWQMRRLTEFIDGHLSGPIATEDLTRIARLSSGHFFRSFKRSFGESPFAYIARRRMLRARELMLSTDQPLSQIALACGLCDQSHFTRVFRRVVGESPNAWRRRLVGCIARSGGG